MKPYHLLLLALIYSCSEPKKIESGASVQAQEVERESEDETKTNEGNKPISRLTVDALELANAYYSDQTKADSLFKDQLIHVNGIVGEVKKMWDGNGVVISLKGKKVLEFVSVYESDPEVAMQFSKNDSIQIEGICTGLLSGVEIHNSKILNKPVANNNTEEKTEYSASEITTMFAENEARASETLSGGRIEISGKIEIKEDSDHWHYVALKGHDEFALVGIHFEGSVPPKLTEGQDIIVKATFSGRSDMINFQKPIIQ
jgi:hypothetical protein